MTRSATSSLFAVGSTILAALAELSNMAAAQTYPSRPVRLLVPFPPGGPSDVAARIVGDALLKQLGQPFVIENRPGAEGAIAAQAVRTASPDGNTLLFSGSSMVPLSVVKSPPPFDVVRDFAPVSQVTRLEWAIYVSPKVPANSISEFAAYARVNPDKLSYVSNNLIEQAAAVQFMRATGIRMVRVPYKGAAQALPDLLTGRVHVNFAPVSALRAYVKDGGLRMLAVLLPERSRFASDVPTLRSWRPGSVRSWMAGGVGACEDLKGNR
jgi:tripartite-type tricarboxylate transporter receptor subunit TctC